MLEHESEASTSSWVGATAKQIARAVRRGDATATEVVADHIQHAPTAQRVLNAMRVFRDAEAIAEAEKVDEQPDLADLPLSFDSRRTRPSPACPPGTGRRRPVRPWPRPTTRW